MSVFICFFIMAITAVHIEGCSYGVRRSAEIIVYSNYFEYSTNHHLLEPVRRFVEKLENATNHKVMLYLDAYDFKPLHEHFRHHPGPVSFIPETKYPVHFINSMTWRPQPGTAHKAHIIILLSRGTYPFFPMEPKIQKLKRAGIEIFGMGLEKFKDNDLYDIVSYPPRTHVFNLLEYPSPTSALSALARSVCRSIEAKERRAKKALLSQVRLADGRDHCQGRVELLYNNTWGWLSDEHWDRPGAEVICRQLGCGPSLETMKGDAFGPSSGNVLERVDCTGDEPDVSECLLGTWTERDLVRPQHSAGVSCLPSAVGNVRLVNGSGPCDGIAEVSVNNTWNRFCLWNFDVREASVVCREVGCGPLVKIQESMGEETGQRWTTVEEAHCSGAEAKISDCSLSVWSSQPCLHNIHSKVVCSTSAISKVTLVGGHNLCSGKVNLQLDSKLHLVPASEWDIEEEAVLCRQLGCGLAIERAIVKEMTFQRGQSFHTDVRSIFCAGHEANLSECGSVLVMGQESDSGEAEVRCSQSGISQVRLVGGDSTCSGRVEVFYSQAWGTICDDTWNLADAQVVCRQVGCGPALRALRGGYFSPGSGSIWLEKVFCNGTETSLSQCGGAVSKNSLCNHSQDAGVICGDMEAL